MKLRSHEDVFSLNSEENEQEKLIRTFSAIRSNNKTVIAIPAYNEEESIGEVISEIKNVIDKTNYPHQIMVLDDGIVDKTKKIIKKNGLLFFSNGCNLSLAQTFRKEMGICTGLGADIILHIDADGQYPPKYIPEMIESVLEGNALVLGSRFGKWIYRGSIGKKLRNQLFAKILCLILRKNIHDITT